MKMLNSKPNRIARTAWIKLRVTPEEKQSIVAKAEAQGQTVTDFIRQQALNYCLHQGFSSFSIYC